MTPLQRGRLLFSATAVVFFAATLYATTNFRLVVAGYFPGFAAGLGLIMSSAVLGVEIRDVRRSRAEQAEHAGDGGGEADAEPAPASGEAAAAQEEVLQTATEPEAAEAAEPVAGDAPGTVKEYLRVLAWLAATAIAIALVGLPVAAVVFLILFLKVEGKESWLYTALATAAAMAFLYGTAELFRLQWPPSLLFG